jgi:hypothetical protein
VRGVDATEDEEKMERWIYREVEALKEIAGSCRGSQLNRTNMFDYTVSLFEQIYHDQPVPPGMCI